MIWAFVKVSPAWRITAWISLFYAAGWLILTQGDPHGVAAGAPMLVYLTQVVALTYNPDSAYRCTFFDAGLPVTGRQLWISKMIVLLAGLWLPVLAASAVGFLVMRNPAMPFLEAAAGMSVIYLLGQSIRIRQFHEPLWACAVLLIVGGGAMCVIDELLTDSGRWVLASYLLAGAVVFLVDLARIPKSFQCAPAEAHVAEPVRARAAGSAGKPGLVWWPVVRSMEGWRKGGMFLLGALALMGALMGGGSVVMLLGFAAPVVAMSRQNWLYLSYLPVSLRKVFWASWMPLPAVIAAGYLIGIWFQIHRSIPAVVREPRIVITALALNLALFLTWGFVFQSCDWHRLRKVPVSLKRVMLVIFPAGLAAAWISIPTNETWHQYGNDPIPYFALKLAGALPENPVLWGLALAIPLAALYWLAERTFCEMEYPSAPQKTMGQAYLQRS